MERCHLPIEYTAFTGCITSSLPTVQEIKIETDLGRHVRLEYALVPPKRQVVRHLIDGRTKERLLRLRRPDAIFQRYETIVSSQRYMYGNQTKEINCPFTGLESRDKFPEVAVIKRWKNGE